MTLKTVDNIEQAKSLIRETGFLPLFDGRIRDFSLNSATRHLPWFTGDENDPWEWREQIAAEGEIAYGKFFNKNAAFVSKEWFGALMNYRRDGYDFDARWDEGLAKHKEKLIMDLFLETDNVFPSYIIKEKAGFVKGGEKGFEGVMTSLQMQCYLVFRKTSYKLNKAGEPYGWAVGNFCTPETLYGQDYINNAYKEEPADSYKRIFERAKQILPEINDEEIRKFLK